MRRRSGGTLSRCSVSSSNMSSSATRPESAPRSPAMALTRVVLPQPERPNSATTPGVGSSKCASSEKEPRRFLTVTVSINDPTFAARGVPTTPTTTVRRDPSRTRRRPSAPPRCRRPEFVEPYIARGARSACAEQHEQQGTEHHRRQHQGKVYECVEKGAPQEPAPGQQPCGQNAHG